MNRSVWIIAPIALLLAGCFDSEVEKLQAALDNATKNIERSSENIKNGMAELASVDPLSLNASRKENELLQDYVDRLKQEILELRAHQGMVKLSSDSRVVFRFTGLAGSFWVDGWVNDRSSNSWIQREQYTGVSEQGVLAMFDIDGDILKSYIVRSVRSQFGGLIGMSDESVIGLLDANAMKSGLHAGINYMAVRAVLNGIKSGEIDRYIQTHLEESLGSYLKQPGSTRENPIGRDFHIDLRLRGGGVHSVYLGVTPIARPDDAGNEWMIQYEILHQSSAGDKVSEHVITTGRIDSSDPRMLKQWNFGDELQVKVATFEVSATK